MRSNTEQPLAILGVLSDTHGYLPEKVWPHLADVDHVFHAGDVGDPEILNLLGDHAPVTAVRGNTDRGPWAEALPVSDTVDIEGVGLIHILHDLFLIDLDPEAAACKIVLHGHLHRPSIRWQHDVLYLNPGSVSEGRHCRESLALIRVYSSRVEPVIIPL